MKGLAVEGLVKKFGKVAAVDDVSFNVGPGEFVSLLGPSGCGKTTTLRCIAGFEQPNTGRITIDGEAVVDTRKKILLPPNKRHFGMVFQSYAVWPHMTVLDNVGYPLRVQKRHSRQEIGERARAKLESVGLDGFEDRYPSQLSGGQQQRVALARALVMEPKVLLFDEPLSNLDAKLRERMRFELIEIQGTLGIPAVYVTHDQAEAMVMSSRVIVMQDGRVAQEDEPSEIYGKPKSRFVADFIGLSNFLDVEVERPVEGGRWLVRSSLGTHECEGSGDHVGDEQVILMFRPEYCELSREPMGGEITFEAVLENSYYVGPYIEYFIRLDGAKIRAQSPTRIDVRPGEPVFGRVGVEHCRLVASGRAAAGE